MAEIQALHEVTSPLGGNNRRSQLVSKVAGFKLSAHWPALVLACIVGLVSVFPSLAAKISLGVDFDHPSNIRMDDEQLYLAKIREVIDGHPTTASPFLWERKSNPPGPGFLAEWVLAQPLKLFGVRVVAGSVLYDFALPALAALLTYVALLRVTGLERLSLLVTAFLFLGLFPNDFRRTVSPQFNFLFWLTQFILLWQLFGHLPNPRRSGLLVSLAAVNYGILVYLHPYYWTFYLALLMLLAIPLLIRGEHPAVPIAVAIGGLAIAVPHLWFMAQASILPEYAETLRRNGLIHTRFPSGSVIVPPGLAVLTLMAIFTRLRLVSWDRRLTFLAVGVVAALVSVNHHVVTGLYLQFSSHYILLSMFWFVFSAAFLMGEAWRKLKRWRPVVSVLVSVVVVVLPIMNLKNMPVAADRYARAINEANRYQPTLTWLARNTARDDVVYAPIGLADVIPIYTHANVYFAYHAHLLYVSDAELLDRFILNNYFERIDRTFVEKNLRGVFGVYYIDLAMRANQENRVRLVLGLQAKREESPREAMIQRVLNRARELQDRPFGAGLARYRVNYVLWDRLRQPSAPFDSLPFLERVSDEGEIRIFRVRWQGNSTRRSDGGVVFNVACLRNA